MPTNLFGNIPYKEVLVVREATVNEKTKEISYLKTTIYELMKRVDAMEKENKINNESVSIKFFALLRMYIF